MEVTWVDPSECQPPHRVTHPEKFWELLREFQSSGWDVSHPCLVGYWFEGSIQLISGSHRWAAANQADIPIPVIIYPYELLWEIWGTDEWLGILRAPNGAQSVAAQAGPNEVLDESA